ncbi:hypothetical protein DSM25558_0338 [Agrobacterium sp. DSM 25558]|nr:hypothetical protein DSM25558_0338 [Agrobacterium sp. DSM 25558]
MLVGGEEASPPRHPRALPAFDVGPYLRHPALVWTKYGLLPALTGMRIPVNAISKPHFVHTSAG